MKSSVTFNKPYELDSFSDIKYQKLVPITEKNRDFIEGCIKLDSTYKSSLPSKIQALKNNYCEATVKDVIREINSVNSTRLSSQEINVLSLRLSSAPYDDICALTKTLNGSISEIKKLFLTICNEITFKDKKHRNKKRKNVSFATKFIFYLSKELGCSAYKNYSKYDSKVAECLANYANVYDIGGYKKHDFQKGSLDEAGLWDMYIDKYNKCLTELINIVQLGNKFKITREEIDHIIWYTQK